MKNALNTNKTVANQYLNPIILFGAKPLMILSILLTAMFILAACGGGGGGGTVATQANPCIANPFANASCATTHVAERRALINTCLASDAANTNPLCTSAKDAVPCIEDPTATGCATNDEFIAAIEADNKNIQAVITERATFCEANPNTPAICGGVLAACTVTTPFANVACDKANGIAEFRTTYCTNAATTWNDNCDGETYTGTTAARNTACRAFGTNAGGDADCHDRLDLVTACPATDPFAVAGCASVDGIDALRTTYCTTGNTIFDLECGVLDVGTAEIITGTHAARNTACETSGTDAGVGNDCATRQNIVDTCTATDPFANTGCNTATHITPQIRTTFCVKTDENDGKNPFTTGCPSSPLLDPALKTARDTACAENGITADATCATRQNIVDTCTATDPFANTGCNTADHILAGNNAIRTEFCTNGVNIFHPMCVETTHGEVNAARANLIATCKDYPTSTLCTTTPINGVAGGTSVAVCNADVFLATDGCLTNDAFNPQRISICTTDATSFTAGCEDTTHGEVDAARLSFAEDCADGTVSTGCDARIDGSAVSGGTGPTVAECNTNPFLDTGCGASPVFNAGRISICTTGATSFNAGCVEATYTGTDAARTSFAEDCADASTSTVGCDTAYINGGDTGSTVAECNTNPFLDDCNTIGSFASEQTARNELCVATNDPFNTACNIDNFVDNNDAARDTYCLTIAVENDANCAGTGGGDTTVRTTEICGATETHNPFAPLCGDSNTADRDTFCGLGQMQTDNLNCSEDAMVQCNRNPFGTNLGKAGTIDCTSGTTYAGQRKILADACRPTTVDTTLDIFATDGATCTGAIDSCNANPFGAGCDADAFADAITSYCTSAETTWNASCDTSAGDGTVSNAVTQARFNVCAANGEVATGSSTIAAGASLFDPVCAGATAAAIDGTTIITAQMTHCAEDDNAWNTVCDTLAGDGTVSNDITVARSNVCVANAEINKDGTVIAAGASLFQAGCLTMLKDADLMRVTEAQATYCANAETTWNTVCDTLAGDGTTSNDFTVARSNVCVANAEINKDGTVIAAGASLFQAGCLTMLKDADLMKVTDAQLTHCKEPANAWQANCGTLAGASSGAGTVKQVRNDICLANGAIVTGTEANDVAAGASLFNTVCADATSADMTVTAVIARTTWCTVGANIFDSQCTDGTHGGVNAARDTACENTDSVLTSVGTNNCISRSDAICGDGTDSNPGSNPFAAICGVATQNINYFASLVASQQNYCGETNNNDATVCDDTVASVCAPGGTALTTDGIFDAICARDTYNTARNSYCSATTDATEGDDGGNCVILKVALCDGTENTDTPYSAVCGMDNVVAQETFCAIDGNSGATGCAATIMAACDVTAGNPFDVLCTEPNTDDRKTRADACRQPSPTVECDPEVMACNADPFGNTAPTDGVSCNAGTNADVYVNAREAYCTVGADIFNDNCGDVNAHGATEAARDAACAQSTTLHSSVGTNFCVSRAPAICGTDAIVGTNPFAAICLIDTQHAAFANNADARAFYCADDNSGTVRRNELTNALCADVTVADWVGSFTGADALATAPTAGADATADNQFLSIEGNTISTEGVTGTSGGGGTAPTVTTLNFTQLEYEGVNLAGADTNNPKRHTAEDGLAFFTGYFGTETELSAYAGIYGTTDLGAPIATDGFAATWSGVLRLSGVADPVNFSLAVGFFSGEGNISGFITDINNTTNDLSVTGTFDANGLITGNVHYSEFAGNTQLAITTPNGVLSGIIGADGAIGVFFNTSGDVYVGGFVATGDCSVDAFSANCPLSSNTEVLTKFCTNTTDNAGRNPHNTMCADGTHGNVVMAREISCGTSDPAGEPCETLVNNLCTGSNSDSILTSAGAGNYNCSLDSAFLSNRQTHCAGTGNSETGVCPSVLAGICVNAASLSATATSGSATYNCLGDSAYDGVRQTFCAGSSSTSGCSTVLAGICVNAASLSATATSGSATYNCLGDSAYDGVRQTFCAGSSSTSGCSTVLAGICVNAASLSATATSGSATYNCLGDSAYDGVRQTFCAGSSSTSGCSTVLAGICVNAASLSATATSGSATYNCLGDSAYDGVRQTFCAGSSSTSGCSTVLAGICVNAASLSATATSGSATYNCLGDSAYDGVRQTFCAGSSSTSGCSTVLAGICVNAASLSATATSGSATYNCLGDSAYDGVRQTFCAGSSSTSGCSTVLAGICVNAASLSATATSGSATYNCLGDSAYDGVRQTFCAGSSSTSGCSTVLAGICVNAASLSATATSGSATYNCLGDSAYDGVRQTFCAGSSSTSGCSTVLAGICVNAASLSATATSGSATYNCLGDSAYDGVRQTFCAGSSSTSGCSTVLAGICVNAASLSATATSGSATYNCLGDSAYDGVRQTFCAGSSSTSGCSTVLAGICVNAASLSATATSGSATYNCLGDSAYDGVRQTFCAGSSSTSGCSTVLAGICVNAASLSATATSGSATYNCLGDSAYDGVRQTFCAGSSSTSGCSTVLAGICVNAASLSATATSGSATYNCLGDSAYDGVRQTFCAGSSSTSGCSTVLAGICVNAASLSATATSGSATYNCLGDSAYDGVRQTFCAGSSSTSGCSTVLAGICVNAASLSATATSGSATYNCLGDSAYDGVRQTFCAGSSSTSGCSTVLAGICVNAASLSATATSGSATYNCLGDSAYDGVRQTFCAGSSSTSGCSTVLAGICVNAASLSATATSGSATYNCLGDSAYDGVRQTFCAGSSSTSGCSPVLAGICVNAASLSATATSGSATYNCLGDSAYDGVRQTFCAGSSSTNGCRTVLNGICSGSNSFLTVTAGTTTYNCSTDTAYNSDRETECSTGGSGDISQCASTVMRVCTGNGVFGPVCLRDDVTANYVNERGVACLAGTARDPLTNALPTDCGTKDSTAGTYIHTYCQEGAQASNHRDCPNTYGTAQGSATATVEKLTSTDANGKDRALNGEGTALLADGDFITEATVVDNAAASSGRDAGRTNFFVDKDRVLADTNLAVPTPLNTGYFTLNSLDPVNDKDTSGFAFARSEYGTKLQDRRYVALLAGTDLGAPVQTSGTSVVWKAKFGGIVNATNITETDFNLTVNFDANTLTASFNVTGFGPVGINGGFTANGVLYGAMSVDNNPNNLGTLTGLIGVDGAVGIFKSHDEAPNPYVGGFVAVPGFADVTADGFKAKARDKTDTGLLSDASNFLDAGAASSFADSVNFIEGGQTSLGIANTTETILLLTRESIAGDRGGVAFTYGNSSGVANYHVGLLSNTNVGPALNAPVAGDWNGFIRGILDGNLSDASQAITFSVDFGDKSFKVKDGTSTTLSAAFGQVTVNGKFLANGVVYGTVDFATGTTNTGTGTLTGLIGQEALVGAFAAGADGTDRPYVGGFTASAPGNTAPPTECSWDADPFGTDCADMMDIDNDDDQTRACIEGTNAARVDFSTRCVMNMEVTRRVCSGSGIRANPFNTAICTNSFSGLTEKKNPLFRIV